MLDEKVIELLSQLSIVIFNIIKDEHKKLNIPVIVGHQGFIVVKEGKLYFRHASSSKKIRAVVDTPYKEYVESRKKAKTWPTLGFNILIPVNE